MNDFQFWNTLKMASPKILAGIAITGVAGTAVQSAVDTPKALKRLEEARRAKNAELTFKEKVFAMAPAYWKTALVALGTMACMTGSVIISDKFRGTLATVAATSIAAAEKIKNNLKQESEETYNKVMSRGPKEGDTVYGEGSVLFCEKQVGYFCCEEKDFLAGMLEINRRLQKNGGVLMSHFLEAIGFTKETEPELFAACDGMGWDIQYVLDYVDGEGPYIADDNPEKIGSAISPEDAEPQYNCHFIDWNVPPIVNPWSYDTYQGIEE